MKYEQIWKKLFLPEMHTYVKELIMSEGAYVLVFLFLLLLLSILSDWLHTSSDSSQVNYPYI